MPPEGTSLVRSFELQDSSRLTVKSFVRWGGLQSAQKSSCQRRITDCTAVLSKIPHLDCCQTVSNRPLRLRRGRFGTHHQHLVLYSTADETTQETACVPVIRPTPVASPRSECTKIRRGGSRHCCSAHHASSAPDSAALTPVLEKQFEVSGSPPREPARLSTDLFRVATEAPRPKTPSAPLPDMYTTGTAQPTMMSAMGNSRSPADDDRPNSSSAFPSMSSRQTPRSYQPTNAPRLQVAPPSTRALHAPRPPRRLGGCRAAPATKGPKSARPAPRRRRRAALAAIRRKSGGRVAAETSGQRASPHASAGRPRGTCPGGRPIHLQHEQREAPPRWTRI